MSAAPQPFAPAISEEEFAVWKADPVTQGVLETLSLMAGAQKHAWVEASWVGGSTNPVLLAELRTRADAFSALAEGSYADFFGVDA